MATQCSSGCYDKQRRGSSEWPIHPAGWRLGGRILPAFEAFYQHVKEKGFCTQLPDNATQAARGIWRSAASTTTSKLSFADGRWSKPSHGWTDSAQRRRRRFRSTSRRPKHAALRERNVALFRLPGGRRPGCCSSHAEIACPEPISPLISWRSMLVPPLPLRPIAVPGSPSAVSLSAHDPPRGRAALAVLVDARWCAARLETVGLMALGLPN
jgi:hypothetical protein